MAVNLERSSKDEITNFTSEPNSERWFVEGKFGFDIVLGSTDLANFLGGS